MSYLLRYKKQIISFILTSVIYIYITDWFTALTLILCVSWHEYCHLYAANKLDLKTQGFYLIPFVGGVSLIKDTYSSLRDKAIVTLAGPIGGTLLGSLLVTVYFFTKNKYVGMAAGLNLLINLFNLLPLSFLDGGQLAESIIVSINEKFSNLWKLISTILAILVIYRFNKIISYIILFTLPDVAREALHSFSDNYKDIIEAEKKISKSDISTILSIYIFTIMHILCNVYYLHNSLRLTANP